MRHPVGALLGIVIHNHPLMGKGGGSIADFYIENGIDASDPDHMDEFLASMHGGEGLTTTNPADYHDPSYFDGGEAGDDDDDDELEKLGRERMRAVIEGRWCVVPEPGEPSLVDSQEILEAVRRHVLANGGSRWTLYETGHYHGMPDVAKTDRSAWSPFITSRHKFHWRTETGFVHKEYVKLYDMGSVAGHFECNPRAFNQAGRKVCIFDMFGCFDANLFWSAVFFYRAVGTTGLSVWDEALQTLGVQLGPILGELPPPAVA